MKIKEVQLNRFKRFTDLKLCEIPESAKLIVLVGPNGSGKTSLFEALNHWYKFKGFNDRGDQGYLEKNDGELSDPITWSRQASEKKVKIEFHNDQQLNKDQIKGKFYFRTAYRNEPDFTVSNLNRQKNPAETIKLQNLIQNDQTVSENYQRLVAQTLVGVYKSSNNSKTVEELREELVGKIKDSLSNIFEDLNLSSIGDPLSNGSFYFEKGSAKDFHYKNLSAGEKSVFDLVLDMIVKSSFYSDAVFCIDEPEAHMHTRLQSKVLREVYDLTPDNSQLWISTHSIGMLKEAEDIEEENPGTVVFLDFDNRDFDLEEIIRPTKISRAIWDRFFDLAFADFSKLLSPKKIVFCEGTSQGRKYKDFDSLIYGKILGDNHHGTTFVSVGSCAEIEDIENQSVKMISNILKSSEIIKFVDRDDKSDTEVAELLEKGVRTSSRRHIECYLLDDEIIRKLCISVEKEELFEECLQAKTTAMKESTERGNPDDDVKSASGKIFVELKKILGLTQCGNNKCAFLRDTMAPLITVDTNIYQEIEKEIFG
ncbi:AAA family ATPase [Pseudoalteromonas sp. L21]|uniref:AAA family ATPase n=1 Tax=Pseudoalteromonas sp. L21 TaxID=1539746 RepID=UPI001F01196A|nr:AAA family ATPase [Pseudoalteromonas sp. L21]